MQKLEGLVKRYRSRIVGLKEHVRKHAKHPETCPKGVGIGHYKPAPDAVCTCGFDELISQDEGQ
jgi:hypothetical protein